MLRKLGALASTSMYDTGSELADCQKKSISPNQPLNSSDQGKLIRFAWLMAPSVVLR